MRLDGILIDAWLKLRCLMTARVCQKRGVETGAMVISWVYDPLETHPEPLQALFANCDWNQRIHNGILPV